jgi:hypothetical protein
MFNVINYKQLTISVIGLLLETIIAAVLAWVATYLLWWLPFIVFPLLLGFGNHQFQPPMSASPNRVLLDFVIMIQQIAWIVVAGFIGYYGFDAWWGAALGAMFGFLGCGIMAPRRWGREVLHEEGI